MGGSEPFQELRKLSKTTCRLVGTARLKTWPYTYIVRYVYLYTDVYIYIYIHIQYNLGEVTSFRNFRTG